MAKKRKLEPKSSESVEAPSQQQQQLKQELDNQHNLEEELDEDEEEEYEEETDDEEEDEEEDSDDEEEANENENVKNLAFSAAGKGDADEPIQNLLEPFSKEKLVALLCEAAKKHPDVADRVRKVADEDPVHRKIFVHGLGWDTNAETLISVFKQYGEIEDCKAVCDKLSGKSKGYGFILFKTRKGARKALEQPQKKIGSRMTACQLASIGPVAGPVAAPATPAQPVSEYTQKKIYVSNVSAELDPQKLLAFFLRYGEIEEGPLGLDRQTGRPKGFCLFVYKTIESARRALEEPHKNFDGHILHCQRAIDGPKPGKSQQPFLNNLHSVQSRRNETPNFIGTAAPGPAHLMAPSPSTGMGLNPAVQALNPALGQALTALLATQGAGLGLTNLLGTLGSAGMNQGMAVAAPGMQAGYVSQGVGNTISPGVMVGYGNQVSDLSQQMGSGGSGRSQHGVGHLGGVTPYMGGH